MLIAKEEIFGPVQSILKFKYVCCKSLVKMPSCFVHYSIVPFLTPPIVGI